MVGSRLRSSSSRSEPVVRGSDWSFVRSFGHAMHTDRSIGRSVDGDDIDMFLEEYAFQCSLDFMLCPPPPPPAPFPCSFTFMAFLFPSPFSECFLFCECRLASTLLLVATRHMLSVIHLSLFFPGIIHQVLPAATSSSTILKIPNNLVQTVQGAQHILFHFLLLTHLSSILPHSNQSKIGY
jgi:hypothetical protein